MQKNKKAYNDLYDGILPKKGLERLLKESPLFNPHLITDEEIDKIKRGFLDALEPSISLKNNSISTKDDDSDNINSKVLQHKVKEDVLFQQCFHNNVNNKSFILHNIEVKTNDYTRLYQWHIFREVTENMMKRIYYMINNEENTQLIEMKKITNNNNNNNNNLSIKSTARYGNAIKIDNNIDTIKNNKPSSSMVIDNEKPSSSSSPIEKSIFMKKIVYSYFNKETITCMEFNNNFEYLTASVLQDILIRDNEIIFLYKWLEEEDYMFIIAFRIIQFGTLDNVKKSSLSCNKKIIRLHRTDMYALYNNENNEINDEKKEDDINEEVITTYYGKKIGLLWLEQLKSTYIMYTMYGYMKISS